VVAELVGCQTVQGATRVTGPGTFALVEATSTTPSSA
jgi:hypothetical protein